LRSLARCLIAARPDPRVPLAALASLRPAMIAGAERPDPLAALARLLLAALVGAQLLYPRVPRRRERAATRAIVGLMLATSLADSAAVRGPRRAAALAGSAAGIGFGAELVGMATGRPFGRYRYGSGLGFRVGGVPLLAAAAWAMMARPAWVVAGMIAPRRAARVALAAGALTAWDVFLDPRMVRGGYWAWPGGGAYEGVPLSNYVGWLATGGAVFAAWARLDPDDRPAIDGDRALALYTWTWIGEELANLVFWRRPRVAAAGGLAMGAFAAPALRARLRA
jgi:uncharacterized membrane protein